MDRLYIGTNANAFFFHVGIHWTLRFWSLDFVCSIGSEQYPEPVRSLFHSRRPYMSSCPTNQAHYHWARKNRPTSHQLRE
jgi:hypothetical protein